MATTANTWQSEAQRYRNEGRALSLQLDALHTQWGIAQEIEKANSAPIWPDFDIRVGGQGFGRQERVDRERAQQWERRHTRKAYFSVPDMEARKSLIKLHRERDEAAFRFHRAENRQAHQEFRELELSGVPWASGAILIAGICIFVGYIGGATLGRWHEEFSWAMLGALFGAVAGIILAMVERDRGERGRRCSIEDARDPLREGDEFYQRVMDDEPIFSAWEERSGEPIDPLPGSA